MDQNEKQPLHTFLPSPAEVLPLLIPLSVVAVVAMAAAVKVTATLLRLVAIATAVTVAVVVMVAVPFLLVLSINCVVGGVSRGCLCDKVSLRPEKGRISRPPRQGPLRGFSPLCLEVPLAPVEDVGLVTGGGCEVLSLGEAEGHGSQEVVRILRSDQT